MIPALVRLPATVLDSGALADLCACVRLVGDGRTVILGAQRAPDGTALDEFVIAAAVSARCPDATIGVAARVGEGRTASIIAREATAGDLLGACGAVVLEGEPDRCEDAAWIIAELFAPGSHSMQRGAEQIHDSRNLPGPSTEGGPAILWRRAAAVWTIEAGEPRRCGTLVEVHAGDDLPGPDSGSLVEVVHPLARPSALAAALER